MEQTQFTGSVNKILLFIVAGFGLHAKEHTSNWSSLDHMVTCKPRNTNGSIAGRKTFPKSKMRLLLPWERAIDAR